MKLTKKFIVLFSLLFIILNTCFFSNKVQAQDVSITVNVLPPYQLNFTDYHSRPNQLLIVLTNRTSNNLNLQLSGSIEGDNGVLLNTIPGTRSNQPVRLGALETRSLSVIEIENLFDINQIQFQGISQQSIARNGILPEGNYTLCVFAQDYRTLAPLSAANPSGCSNIFPINSLEAPVILKPFDEEEVSPVKPQNIVFTWTTPPNTPPGAYYIFNLVELLNDKQSPGAAIQTKTGINSFETKVYGNALLFGPDQFPLTNNKRYAVQVTVVDPLGKSLYRNNGKSEVIVFNYGNAPLASTPETKQQQAPPIKNKKPVTTNRISGKIGWAFLESEENFKSPINGNTGNAGITTALVIDKGLVNVKPIVDKNPMPLADKVADIISVKDASYLGGASNVQSGAINVPGVNKNISNSGKNAFTILPSFLSIQNIFKQNNKFFSSPLSQYVLGNFNEPEYSVVGISDKVSTNIHPLQVSLVLLGVKNTHEVNVGNLTSNNVSGNNKNINLNPDPSNNKKPVVPVASTPVNKKPAAPTTTTPTNNNPGKNIISPNDIQQTNNNLSGTGIILQNTQYKGMDVIGSTRSNASGEFNLDFISADYLNTTKYSNFILRVLTPDGFAKVEITLSREQLKDSSFDVGQLIAKAISHRLTINASAEGIEQKSSGSGNKNGSNNSSSGNSSPGNSALKKIENNVSVTNIIPLSEGKFKYEIYRKKSDIDRMPYLAWEGNLTGTLPAVSIINGTSYFKIANYSTKRTTGRLFHTGTYLVRLMNNDTTKYAISNMEVVCNKKSEELRPVEVTITKKLLLQMPVITGNVSVNIANKELFGIPNVLVRVKFDKNDVDNSGLQTILLFSVPGSIFNTVSTNQINELHTASISMNGPSAYNSDEDEYSNKITQGANKNNSNVIPPSFNQVSKSGTLQTLVVNEAAINAVGINSFALPEYSTLTDSMGNYVIGNLPVLLPGKTYEVIVGRLPFEYKNLPVLPADKQTSSAIAKGEQGSVNFTIVPKIGLITATVVDENKVPLPFALLQFKGASNPFEANEKGVFTTQYIAGKQKLIISKEGYITKEVDVTVPEMPDQNSGAANNGSSTISPSNIGSYLNGQTKIVFQGLGVSENEANKVINNNTPEAAYKTALDLKNNKTFSSSNVSQNAYGGNNFSLKNSFNYVSSGSGTFSATVPAGGILNSIITPGVSGALGTSPMGTVTVQTSLGNIGFLKEKFGRAKIVVVDKATGTPIANAQVKLFDTTYVTNTNGEALHKGRGGQVTITVYPPAESLFAAAQIAAEVIDDGTEPIIKIELQKGVRVSGKVTSGGSQVADANISVIGSDFIKTTTNSAGTYSLVMASGAADIKAGRQGYIGTHKNISIQNTDVQNFDFDLEGGNGKNISTLLGFDIELESKTTQGAKESWSGSFINLTPGNNIFSAAKDLRINFSNVLISYDANGNAIPDGAGVKTDATSIPLKLFNWLPVNIEDAGGVMVLKDNAAAGKGKIGGKINVDLSRLSEVRGLGFDEALKPSLTVAGNSTAVDIFPFSSATTNSGNQSFAFVTAQSNKLEMTLYGFKVEADLSKTTITSDKIIFKGKIFTPDLGIIQATSFDVDELSVSKDFKITGSKIILNNSKITIGSWQATLSNLSLGDNGFKLAGQLKVRLPASKESVINFDNLSVGKDAVFGGSFSFPSGIDILNAVQFKTGSTPFSFGRVGNSSVYRLGGSGNIHFNKFFTKDISIPVFQVQTDGKFNLSVPVNISQNLVFADFSVTAITFNTIASNPYVGVTGDIKLTVPLVKLSAGDFKFYSTGKFEVGKIGASLSIPGFSGSAAVTLAENGFEGEGNLKFAALFDVGIKMHYWSLPNNKFDFGASFLADVNIPIGLVTIEKVGGGFDYNSESGVVTVNVRGAASFTGTGQLVRLNPISVTVSSNMIFEGLVSVEAFTFLKLADAKIVLNVPDKLFTIAVDVSAEPVKGLLSMQLKGDLVLSVKPGDEFIFLGSSVNINVFDLIKTEGEFALGVKLKNPKNRGDITDQYFTNADQGVLGDVFTGMYVHGFTSMGVKRANAWSLDIGFAKLEAWLYCESGATFIANIETKAVEINVRGMFEGGAKATVAWVISGGVSLGACMNIGGGYDEYNGLHLYGKAQGYAEAHLGTCEPDCNDWCWIGLKVCLGAGVNLSYAQRGFYLGKTPGLHLGFYAEGSPKHQNCY
ncbi:MAG: hypothetical protein ABIP30_17245 [Ferruginibacter sp.]